MTGSKGGEAKRRSDEREIERRSKESREGRKREKIGIGGEGER